MNDGKKGLPLRDIRVLDITRLIPGALCTLMLGDYGAEVIKVERPEIGDYERRIPPFIGDMASRFLLLNRNKKSVVLDLKKEEGRQIFVKMAAGADVLVEGFRPGVMDRLGLGPETLEEVNPKLVYCSISSFGQEGPYRDVVAHDINILALAGFFEVTGTAGGAPVIPGLQIADAAAGVHAALGILMALMQRERTGTGQHVDVSMFDGLLSWMFDAARYVFAGKKVPGPGKGRLWGGLPNYNLYKTKDGKYMAVGALETKFMNKLLQRLGREDLTRKTGEVTSNGTDGTEGRLRDFFLEVFQTRTRDEWMEMMAEMNVCVTPVNSVEEALAHPQALFRGMVTEGDHPTAGRTGQLGSPLKFSRMRANVHRSPAPGLGEHTRDILKTLGYCEDEIDDLARKGVIISLSRDS